MSKSLETTAQVILVFLSGIGVWWLGTLVWNTFGMSAAIVATLMAIVGWAGAISLLFVSQHWE